MASPHSSRAVSTPAADDLAALNRLLRRRFGFKQLRQGQKEVIERVLRDESTLAIMPTGAGKSLCYQLPSLALPGRTVVVSPLIALMKDQRDRLAELGIAAVQCNSATDAEEAEAARRALESEPQTLVFTTPERLADAGFIASLRRHPVSLLVVDEAHCISQWGHDFRPAFLEIAQALPALGRPPVLALTATADAEASKDIARQLGIPAGGIVHTGSYRPNLHYRVEQVTRETEKLPRVLARLRACEGSGIVYVATVKAAEAVHAALAEAGESVALYHGKLGPGERHAAQEAFMSGERRVMVATNAFGLGIDKADIRFVLHYQMPSGLNAYYQEAGRAGRDGAPAECTLLFLHSDRAVQQFFLAGRYPGLDDLQALHACLMEPPPDAAGWTLEALQERLDRPRSKLQVGLNLMRSERIITRDRQGRIRLMPGGVETPAFETLAEGYREKREQDRHMLEQMVFYGQTAYCRWRTLLRHFDPASPFDRCHTCDNCLAAASRSAEPIEVPKEVAPSPAALRAFSPGDAVKVPRYGRGTVLAADAQSVTVAFDGGEERCFQPAYVRAVRQSCSAPKSAIAPPSTPEIGTSLP